MWAAVASLCCVGVAPQPSLGRFPCAAWFCLAQHQPNRRRDIMNRLTSGLAIGTVALFAATGFAFAQAAPDAAASGSPPAAAPSEGTTPESSAPAPADQPAQAGGMQSTSDTKNGKKPCEPTTQSSSTDPAKATTGCRKPK